MVGNIGMRKQSAFIKEVERSVTHTWSRFVAIFAIVALGAGFYTGLSSTAPDMRITGSDYCSESNMMDVRLISTAGFTQEDAAAVAKDKGIDSVMASHTRDVMVRGEDGGDRIIRIHGIPDAYMGSNNKKVINRPVLVSGRWPKKHGECVMDTGKMRREAIKLGAVLTIEDGDGKLKDHLKYSRFKIVGFVHSAYYLSFSLGSTGMGNGTVNRFMYIRDSDFAQPFYTEMFATVKGAREVSAFGSRYDDLVNPVEERLKKMADSREDIRYREWMDEAGRKIEDAKREYEDAKEDVRKKLDEAARKLDSAASQIAGQERKLADGRRKYSTGMEQLKQQQTDLTENMRQTQSKIDAERAKITAGYDKLKAMAAEDAAQTSAGKMQVDRQKAFLDASSKALDEQQAKLDASAASAVSKLDLSRAGLELAAKKLEQGRIALKEAKEKLRKGKEEYSRQKAGADKKLTDAARKIANSEEQVSGIKKPEWYVLDRHTNVGFASFDSDAGRMESISTVFPIIFFLVAALVALTTMTRMVEEERGLIGTYKSLGYSRLVITLKYLAYAAIASIFGSIAGIAVGSRVLPVVIWNAYRIMYTAPSLTAAFNLKFALIGTSAAVFCTMSATFAACRANLSESPASLILPKAPKAGKRILLERVKPVWKRLSFIQKVTARNLFRYKKRLLMTVIGIAGCTGLLLTGFGLKDSISGIVTNQYGRIFKYNSVVELKETPVPAELSAFMRTNFSGALLCQKRNCDVSANGRTFNSFLFVPEKADRLKEFIALRDRVSGRALPFDNGSAVLSEKLANLLKVGVGGSIGLNNGDRTARLTVTGITENYIYNYVYFSAQTYRSMFGEEPGYNQFIAKAADEKAVQQSISKKLFEMKGVGTVSFLDNLTKDLGKMIDSLNEIVVVLIASAGLLAFIVLYNLTNINILERQREIATIKVLGFYDKEVSSYIYRETSVLTAIGCILGLGLGILMHAMVIGTVEVDMVMFGRTIKPVSFAWSALLTMFFSFVVSCFMYYRLKRIDMVESMKSVE